MRRNQIVRRRITSLTKQESFGATLVFFYIFMHKNPAAFYPVSWKSSRGQHLEILVYSTRSWPFGIDLLRHAERPKCVRVRAKNDAMHHSCLPLYWNYPLSSLLVHRVSLLVSVAIMGHKKPPLALWQANYPWRCVGPRLPTGSHIFKDFLRAASVFINAAIIC